ncbi:MAG: hypothetical protein O2943_02150 [Actinomycetota bacterium]|nr:hypothetical protein [Actinomycetota bacterium]
MIPATCYRMLPSGDAEIATEDGRLLPVTAQVVAAGGFRYLRVGQQVAIELTATGTVTSIHLPT